jgi:hypothetical protein
MIRPILTVFLALLLGRGLAQDPNYLHNRTVMERVPSVGQVGNVVSLGNMAVSAPGVVGDVYLHLDYRNATFWLYDENKIAQGFPAKLDLQRNEFDVHLGKNGIRALSGNMVKTFAWADSVTKVPQYFVNGKEYKDEEGTPYIGFFQILSEGEITLLKMTRVDFKPADRNPTHNTGSKDNRFLKTVNLYYAVGTTAKELPGKKGITKLFGERTKETDKFIKVNEINLGKENHLVALFDYYNSLVKK